MTKHPKTNDCCPSVAAFVHSVHICIQQYTTIICVRTIRCFLDHRAKNAKSAGLWWWWGVRKWKQGITHPTLLNTTMKRAGDRLDTFGWYVYDYEYVYIHRHAVFNRNFLVHSIYIHVWLLFENIWVILYNHIHIYIYHTDIYHIHFYSIFWILI